jgi:hypothetical protein
VVIDEQSVADPARSTGLYEREGLHLEVSTDDAAHLLATVTPTHEVAQSQGWPPMIDLPLQPTDRPDTSCCTCRSQT